MDSVFDFHAGQLPLLVSLPHVGTAIPADVLEGMTNTAHLLQDTDWHLVQLYDFARDMGASVISARVSRYVIDLNRPPDGSSLYPGKTTTGLCPTETFRGEPLYKPGREPDADEQARRLQQYWQPYHEQLQAELHRLKAAHGRVLLWDGHSIASQLPRLFDGQLPDLNLGTADGASCSPALSAAVLGAARDSGFSQVLNGRFKGGYITRHYGAPASGVQAIQLEMTQRLYMSEAAPFGYDATKAAKVQPVMKRMMQAALVVL